MITDTQVANLFMKTWRPAEYGDYESPSFKVSYQPMILQVAHKAGTTISSEALIIAPKLNPPDITKVNPVIPRMPELYELDNDYSILNNLIKLTPVASETTFRTRLEICRTCTLWNETRRQPTCDSVNCNCSRKLPWLANETCPENKWTN